MHHWINGRVSFHLGDHLRVLDSMRQPTRAPEVNDTTSRRFVRRQQVLRSLAAAEQDFPEILCEGDSVNDPRTAMLKQQIGWKADCIKRAPHLPQLGIDAFAKNTIHG